MVQNKDDLLKQELKKQLSEELKQQLVQDEQDKKRHEEELKEMAQELIAEKKERLKEEIRLDQIYAKGEVPPMPLMQRMILGILALVFLLGFAYVLWSHWS